MSSGRRLWTGRRRSSSRQTKRRRALGGDNRSPRPSQLSARSSPRLSSASRPSLSSGLFVINVDTADDDGGDGIATFRQWIEEHGDCPAPSRRPPGVAAGMCIEYQRAFEVATTAGKLAPGIDVRGAARHGDRVAQLSRGQRSRLTAGRTRRRCSISLTPPDGCWTRSGNAGAKRRTTTTSGFRPPRPSDWKNWRTC